MYIVKAVQQLLDDILDLGEFELDAGVVEQSGEVVFAELKHQVERGVVASRRSPAPTPAAATAAAVLGATDFDELHDVCVVEQLKDAEFAKSRDRKLQRGYETDGLLDSRYKT